LSCNEIENILFPNLQKKMETDLGSEQWNLKIDEDRETILFYYPRLIENRDDSKRVIKLELGAKSDHFPSSLKTINHATSNKKSVHLKVLAAERSFWEKATILHKFANFEKEKNIAQRQSRHFYDFYCLLQSEEIKRNALKNVDLLKIVIEHTIPILVESVQGWNHDLQ
jgi:hypothetical protein